MMWRALILVHVARLAAAQLAGDAGDAIESETTAADRAEALDRLVRRTGARAYPEVVLHLFDPDAEVRARAATLLALIGDPENRARKRLEALGAGVGVDADSARAALAALDKSRAPPVAPPSSPAIGHPSMEPARPGDAELLARGAGRESIIPPFDAATTAGKGRASMDVQVGAETVEVALRVGFHKRADVGFRLWIHPEGVMGPQIRWWHPATSWLHVLITVTPYVFGSSSDYEYDSVSDSYRRRNHNGLGAVGAGATLGGRQARLALSAEQRGLSSDLYAVLSAGPEVSLIPRMLNLRIAAQQVRAHTTEDGILFAVDAVF